MPGRARRCLAARTRPRRASPKPLALRGRSTRSRTILRSIACRASSSIWSLSLEAEPSTPRPTRIQRGLGEERTRSPSPAACRGRTVRDARAARAQRTKLVARHEDACANHTSGPVQPTDSAKSTGRRPYCSTQYFSSSTVSHRCVCRWTPSCLRASSEVARMSSGVNRERRARREHDPRHGVARRIMVLGDDARCRARSRPRPLPPRSGGRPPCDRSARHRTREA